MWKKAMFTVACMVLSVGGLAQAQDRTAAMIVSSAGLSAGFDRAMHDRLAAMGYNVTVVVDTDVTGGVFTIEMANTYDLLLVSESIGSSRADSLIGTTTPTMHNESYGWDNWFLTTATNIHWATGASVDVVNDTHPIAAMAGVKVGPMAFFSTAASWTTESVSALAPGAELIAQITDAGTDCAIVFAVEEGAQLANGSAAPARIAGFSIPGNNSYDAGVMTNEAWALFDATIRWLTHSALPTLAKAPSPADTVTDVPRDVVLSWGPGASADRHDVYFGTSFDDVNDGIAPVSPGQDANSYDPGLLEYGQTYYWRVDEIGAPPESEVFKGGVWSFTTEPYAYPVTGVTATASGAEVDMGPENTVNGSGLNAQDQHSTEGTEMWLSSGAQPAWIQFELPRAVKLHEMWIWNSNQLVEAFIGFGARGVLVEYSLDGETWTALEGVPEFARASGTPTYTANTTVDFGGVLAKYVKLTIHSNWGGVAPQTGLSEVRFFSVPVQARVPIPADGATGVVLNAELRWRPGREATSHEVFLGTDPGAVADGTVAGQIVTEHNYTPGTLNFGTRYFWKVDEVGEAGTYPGSVWRFTSQEFQAIDDFEAYNDDDHRIYESWIDGLTTNASGSQVGYDVSPFAERIIVHSGRQSMPLAYDNTRAPFLSEAEREFTPTQDWTTSGADTLSLWVQGVPAGFLEDAGTITMSGAGHDIWDNADDFRFAYKTLNGDGSILVKVESLVNTNAWAKAGVMIRQSLDADSKFVYMIQSFNSGVSMGNRAATAGGCASTTVAGIAAPQWVKLTRKGDVFTAQYSADGAAWTDLKAADGTVASATVAMTNPVHIGLCVTSHNTAATTTAVMSGVNTTGNVTGGSWQVQAIGDDPQPANDPAELYVTVRDGAGKTATATNPTAVTTGVWTQWRIPLSEFAGVNMTRVNKLILGVDNRNSLVKGAGTIYVDDIGFGHPVQ